MLAGKCLIAFCGVLIITAATGSGLRATPTDIGNDSPIAEIIG